jgi:heptosyltransferase III
MSAPLRPPTRVLVIATQRLGDVLLATPLIRSLRRAWPQAHIAALVFADTAPALAANPDLDAVLTVARRPALGEHVKLFARLWRRYDVALSTGTGDRPTIYAWIAGKRRLGLLERGAKTWWKRALLHAWEPFDSLNTHTVVMNLCLADRLEVARSHEVVTAWSTEDATRVREVVGQSPYAVLHLHPKFAYKAWH